MAKETEPHFIVAIGASAGGGKALKDFFFKVKNAENVSFIVIQHIDESASALAASSLRRFTRLRVAELKNNIKLVPGTVYSVPSHTLVSFAKKKTKLTPAKTIAKRLSVIDHLFSSLAKEYTDHAIGVVLSGNASDGSAGIKTLNEAGALTIAQIPNTAEHSSMPEHAILTGAVDHILPPNSIWREINAYRKYMAGHDDLEKRNKLKEHLEAALVSICDILQKSTRHDFKHYKTSTLLRRIQRRMQVLQINSVPDYLDFLKEKQNEIDTLFNELLINVTSFFRDKDSFETLKTEVLKNLIQNVKDHQKIRIWVAGCSTGEEAYSIAILLSELLEKVEKPPEVQIIATDLDDNALTIARRGSYPATITEHVSHERLAKFFTKKNGRYLVNKNLREMCLFSIHNLIVDPPFSQIDLISCRNVLIYMGSHLQKKLFPVFHYALKANGYLFLGTSETLTSHKELFKPISSKHRIAQRKPTAIKLPSIATSVQNYLSHFQDVEKISETDLSLISQRIALDEMPLRYAVVNDESQILSSSAGLNKYVQISEGAFQNNIIKLVVPTLRAALRSAFNTAKKEKRKIVNDTCTLKVGATLERIAVIVQPMPKLGDLSDLYWVAFQNLGTVHSVDVGSVRVSSEEDAKVIDQLERELLLVRQELDKSVQDLEASNEELKSSNEELLSMNEELQSANEEMETSKEEIQLINDALQRANADLENLLAGTEIATLFLDKDLKIRGFTPAITDIYPIQQTDIDRDIRDFNSAAVEMPKYPEQRFEGILEHEVRLPDGRIFQRRVLPYKSYNNIHDGLVVTFIDVTNLRALEMQYRELADSMPNIVWTTDENGVTDYLNEQWYEFSGYERGAVGTESWLPILHPDDAKECVAKFKDAFEQGHIFEMEYRFWDRKNASYRWFLGRAVPVPDKNGKIKKWIGTAMDIHDRVMAEEARHEADRLFQIVSDNAPAFIWLSGLDKKRFYFNKGWRDFTGQTLEQALEEGWRSVVHPDDLPVYLQKYHKHFDEKSEFYFEYRLKHHSGAYRWIGAKIVPRTGVDGEFAGFVGACLDIHEQRIAREALMASERRLETMIATSPSFMCVLRGPEHVYESTNDQYRLLIGQRNVIGKTVAQAVPEIAEQGFTKLLDKVRQTAQPYVGKEVPVLLQRSPGKAMEKRFLDIVYQPYLLVDGRVDGILVHGVDVTEKVLARARIENERQNFRNLFKQTPEMVCILSGPEHHFEFVNEAHVKVLGFDATGRSVRDAQPESVEVHGILDNVYQTGKTAELHEIPVTVGDRLRFFNLTYSARRDDEGRVNGVMILGLEVTEQILTRESYRLQRDALELAVNRAPMSKVLENIAKMVELQAGGELLASISLADNDQVRLLHGAAPSLPADYNEAIAGMRIGAHSASSGTAAYTKDIVVVEDISASHLWKDYEALARRHGLKACWSIPIQTATGKLLGTFSLYAKTPRKPTDRELQLIEDASQITSLIIERQLEVVERLEREEQLAFATASAKMGMWSVQLPEGRVLLSDEAAKIFGFSKSYSHTDLAIDEFIHPNYRDKARAVLADAIANKKLYNDEYQIVRPDKEIRWINARGHARYDENGQPYLLSGLIMDITEQKAVEHEVKQARLAAENASAAKTRFLANMSHEIRTPLSAIIGFSDLLQSQQSKEGLSNGYIERISRNAAQLGRLIDELLDLSKIEADKLEIEKRDIKIDDIIEDVYSTMILRADSKGLQLNFKWLTEKPTLIKTDPTRLSQILVNIIGNAVKFTERGSVDVEFSVHQSRLTVMVKDSGIGLTEDQQKRIFDPFMQADPSVSRKYGGTGLGLALSKRIAALLGGDILLEESRIDVGSVFKIEIAIEPATAGSTERFGGDDTEKPGSLKGKRILVVDDSIDNREIVSLFLKATEAEIIEGINGQECIQLAQKIIPDLILLDIQMPVLDGYQAMQRLKMLGYDKPVIALTAHAFKEERDRCLSLGFSAYITKPVNKKLLISTIQDLIVRRY